MKNFLKHLMSFSFIALIPVLIVFIAFFYLDPFKVVYKYKTFYISGQPRYVTLNYDYVAMETFLYNYPTYKYNSFIIGNSRSRFYEMDKWSKLIHSDKCFHFDASVESLYGICKKIEFLDQQHVEISNVMLVIDYSTLIETVNSNGHLVVKHPLLSGQSKIGFEFVFMKAFCSIKFLFAYLDFKLSGKIKPYMITGTLLDDIPVDYNLKFNEMKLNVFEDSIKIDPSKYYNEKRMKVFYPRDSIQKFYPEVIKAEQIVLLNRIKAIFKKHSTNYKIIISPMYDQMKLCNKDLVNLRNVFGTENIYDFSGINHITSDYHNFYEASHYRPHVANQMMDSIYN
ncbi:MAG: hypothetical protein WCO13_07865 [Bacteroidota bacterium]